MKACNVEAVVGRDPRIDTAWRQGQQVRVDLATGTVRRRGFWDHRRCELTEALVHQDCHFRRPLVDEASGVV